MLPASRKWTFYSGEKRSSSTAEYVHENCTIRLLKLHNVDNIDQGAQAAQSAGREDYVVTTLAWKCRKHSIRAMALGRHRQS